ncbi:hypothetical protein PISL3812_05814 [Talaromyces islandicus]|uniref:Tyrosyl-DNA phosphodiesterase 1 n=1 Tax=Talaromyces islandicus TaxID=28573 RepID=A0A0U1LZS1_TALIS|nr:hypothetical protein PISL3812_05814 [Talaromyces islandicus]
MSLNEDEDPQLTVALLRSMQDQQHGLSGRKEKTAENLVDLTGDSDNESQSQKNHTINLDEEEEEDDDLKRAIALSMQQSSFLEDPKETPEGSGEAEIVEDIAITSKLNEQPPTSQSSNAFGILGLDRKKLEQERLARIAKRKAEQDISPPPLSRERKAAKYTVTSSENATAKPLVPPQLSSSQINTKPPINEEKKQVSLAPSSTPSIQFPKGTVKKTWVFRCPRNGDDIKIEEVLQCADLELAVLSAFQFDMEWLFTKFQASKTRFMLMMQAKDEITKRQYEADTANMPRIRLCFPPMDGQVNCMHSKLMLLFHPGYLRIVVPSANLVPYDWGETGGVMENIAFLIDLPKKPEGDGETSQTAFYDDLVYFLKASTLHQNIIDKLSSFDFAETARYAFVHTIGGSHDGDAWRRTGHCGLGRAVNALGLRAHTPVNVDFITSSVGSLTDEFLRSIYLSAQGNDGLIEYTLRTNKSFPAKTRADPPTVVQKTTGSDWKDRFRVYYPSQQTVNQSRGGPQCAGTICFQEKWFNGPKFPRHVLHDCISQREGVLMHNKMLFARPETPIKLSGGSTCAAWAYIGSANLSESAWGRLVQDRATKEPKLNCRNWECGVIVPVIQDSTEEKDTTTTTSNIEKVDNGDMARIFGCVPVPMRIPAPSFAADHDRKPWYGAW